MSRPLLAILSAALCSATLIAQDSTLPRFRDFAVRDTYQAKPVEPDTRSTWLGRRFRTVIRRQSRVGPNFAGSSRLFAGGVARPASCMQSSAQRLAESIARQCRPKLARRFTYRARY